MIRKQLVAKRFGHDQGIRWRGGEVSRLEGFSDAVFAFALTLLIVATEVPRNFDDLFHIVQGFPAFAVTFLALVGIWYFHYRFFRRYGLQDGVTMILNTILLLLILFYVYPLKFLTSLLITEGVLHAVMGIEVATGLVIKQTQGSTLMIVYGAGFLAVFLVLTLLQLHAYRKRELLQLDAVETSATLASARALAICVVVAMISLAIVIIGGREYTALSGWIYALIGPLQAIHGVSSSKRAKRLIENTTPMEEATIADS